MFLSALSSALHYILHTIDRQSEDPWENKPIYMRLVDIVLGMTIDNTHNTHGTPPIMTYTIPTHNNDIPMAPVLSLVGQTYIKTHQK